MKKWLIAFGLFFILIIISIYLFIPSKIVISVITTSKVTINGEIRFLSEVDRWAEWWINDDGKHHELGKPFTYQGTIFQLTQFESKAIGVRIKDQGLILNSLLSLGTLTTDSTLSLWQCTLNGSYNPFVRVSNYKKAIDIRKKMAAIMGHFSAFVSNTRNVYGINIYRTSTNDTLLLSAKYKSGDYPTTATVYDYFQNLENNVKKQHATVTGYPMIHVEKMPDGTFQTQVALPTSRWLRDEGQFFSRRMVKGYFMVTDVTGGAEKVKYAASAMDNYIIDYRKTRMAIPFQYWITNRAVVSDSSCWITRIFIPVTE